MKIWLFAAFESIIAALGLAAFFWAESIPLTAAAVVGAAALGIAQPLLAARQSRRMQRYQEGVFAKSQAAVDEQVDQLLTDIIDPPLPHRPTVVAFLERYAGIDIDALLAQYDRLVKAIASKSFAAEELAAAFTDKTSGSSLGIYLCGLAALSQKHLHDAHHHFSVVTGRQPTWIAPWLGWAAAAYELNQFEEIAKRHPHVNGANLTPYDVGDEATFIGLDETVRDDLVEQFQTAARALGNYYTLAEMQLSKQRIEESQAELRKVA